MKEQVEVSHILAVVEDRDEPLILLRRAVYLKPMYCPDVRLANQLRPLPLGSFTLLVVRSQRHQVLPTIRILQRPNLRLVRCRWNITQIVDSIEVSDQRHGNPVIAVDLVIPADHHPILPLVANPKRRWRISTDVIQVNRCMSCRIHGAKCTIRLFHQQRDRCVRRLSGHQK